MGRHNVRLAGRRFFLALALVLACTARLASAQALPPSCTFTDAPINIGVTVIKAAHIVELRACINDIRAQRSLPAASWTDPVITPQQSVIKAVHISELRSAITQVYTGMSLPPPQFTDTLTPSVSSIRVVHINELRTAAVGLYCGGIPTISSLNPTWGPVGTTVTVSGTNFGNAQCGSTVRFNGTLASPSQWGATTITLAVPSGATTGNVVVTVGGFNSNGALFTVGLNPPTTPTISSLSPLSGAIGTLVTITGSNLGGTVGSSTVLFNNSFSAPIMAWSPTSITASVPVAIGQGVQTITVRAGTDTSNGWPFTVETTPPVGDPGGSVEYYHQDAIGSIRLITNGAGAEVKRFDYLPFGQEWTSTSSHPNPLRFTGKERDRQTEFGSWTALDYFGARYYQGQTGRFTGADPVLDLDVARLDPQRWNRYTYTRNSPFRHIDPDGRDTWDLAIGFGQGIGGGAVGTVKFVGSLIVDPVGTVQTATPALKEHFRLLWAGIRNPSAVVDAYVGLATSNVDADQRTLGAAIGGGAFTAALIVAPLAEGGATASMAQSGTPVFRVWGGEAPAWGKYWTTVNPESVANFRSLAGLPRGNTGRFVTQGTLRSSQRLTTAKKLYADQQGGIPQMRIENPEANVDPTSISEMHPPF